MSDIKSEDLIERLRNGTKLPALQALLNEAADRIEELTEAVSKKENTTPRSIPVKEDTIYDMVRNLSLEDMAKAMSFVATTKGCCFPQDKRCEGKTSWCCGDCWKEYLSTKRGMGDGTIK